MEHGCSIRLAGPEDLHREMERFMAYVGRSKRQVFRFEKAWRPRCDVSESEGEFIVVFDLAGVSAESVSIEVEGHTLLLRGVRKEPGGASGRRFYMMEINYGIFEREIPLPAQVETDGATARFKDGFLEVRLPKLPARGPREVDIDVASD